MYSAYDNHTKPTALDLGAYLAGRIRRKAKQRRAANRRRALGTPPFPVSNLALMMQGASLGQQLAPQSMASSGAVRSPWASLQPANGVQSLEELGVAGGTFFQEVVPPITDEQDAKPGQVGRPNSLVGALIEVLAGGPRTVANITNELKLANQKHARNLIDAARRVGHSIDCVGRCTFALGR